MKSRRYSTFVRFGALLVFVAASPILRAQPAVMTDTTLVCNLELDPPVMRWDEEEQRYIDTTFTATVTVTNTGGFPQSDVEVEIRDTYDPDGRVEFNPKFINENPVTFPVLFPSASKSATWHFRTLPNTTGTMQVVELGVSYGSNEVPRIYNACNAILQLEPEKTPYFVCSIEMPDTIRVNAYGTGLEPNPFDVVFEVENIGNGNGSIVDLTCNFPDIGLSLSQLPANTRTRLGNWELHPGEIDSFTWTFDVAHRLTSRNVSIEVVAHANNGDTIICEKTVYIEPVTLTSSDDVPAAPSFSLGRNYPNPFSSYTEISYTMASETQVSVAVYSILGREVAALVNGRKNAGAHTARFDAQDLPGGVYIVRMKAAGFAATRVMFLQR